MENESTNHEPTAPMAPVPDGPSDLGLLSVIFSPRATFEAVARRPIWSIPLVVLFVGAVLLGAATLHIAAPEQMEAALEGPFGEQIAEDPEFYDNLEAARSPTMGKRFTGALMGAVGQLVMTIIGALFYHLAAKLLGGQGTLKLTLTVVVLATWVGGILGTLVKLPVIFAKHSVMSVSFSAATLLSAVSDMDSGSPMYRFLSLFTDVFSLWMLFLLALGLGIGHRLSTGKAWTAALLPWLLGNGILLAMMVFTTG